jgi:hypothetical protein
MHRNQVDSLGPAQGYWIPAVVSPERDWPGAPGCRRGARFMVDCETLAVSRDAFEPFDSQSSCLQWIMRHRAELNLAMPRATVRAVRLDRWLLGLE